MANIRNITPFRPGTPLSQYIGAGSTDDLLVGATLTLTDQAAFTIPGIGIPGNLSILQVPEIVIPTTQSTSPFVRFVNLSSDVPPLNVSDQNGSTIFQNVGYKDYSLYHRMNPGDYTLHFNASASGLKLFDDLDVQLKPGMLYSLYTIGYDTDGESVGDGDGEKRRAILIPDGQFEKTPA